MKNIGILGSGGVAQELSVRMSELGYNVMIGTRDVQATLSKSGTDNWGRPLFKEWYEGKEHIKVGTFSEAASFGEILINATIGTGSLEALNLAGAENTSGKILIDISNPLDFSKGFPPTLFVCNDDSLGELIQRANPDIKVVKALNTLTAGLMLNPRLLQGDHSIFVCGNDNDAKNEVKQLFTRFGWKESNMIDLGDITNARGTEQILPIWVRIMGAIQTPIFNFNIVR